MSIPFNKFEEDVFLTTVLIENLDDNEFGTGFLVRKPVEPDQMKILLFSNKHVSWGKQHKTSQRQIGKFNVTFHLKTSGAAEFDGGVVRITLTIDRAAGYYEHADPDVDVACANISPLFEARALSSKLLPFGELADFEFSQLHAGYQVLFVGYPSGFYDKKHSLPVLRVGHIASIPAVNFDGRPQVLIDAPVFPGSSGSPVFAEIGGRYKLLGIAIEAAHRYLDFLEVRTPHKTAALQASTTKIPVQFIGLGILYKIETLRDVFNLA